MFQTDDGVYFNNDKELRKYETKEDLYNLRYIILPFAMFGIITAAYYLISV